MLYISANKFLQVSIFTLYASLVASHVEETSANETHINTFICKFTNKFMRK